MKKTMKKIGAALLAAMMVMSVTGCSQGGNKMCIRDRDYTAYEGMKIRGSIELVMQRGNIIVKDNHFLGKQGDGHFIFRKPLSLCE